MSELKPTTEKKYLSLNWKVSLVSPCGAAGSIPSSRLSNADWAISGDAARSAAAAARPAAGARRGHKNVGTDTH